MSYMELSQTRLTLRYGIRAMYRDTWLSERRAGVLLKHESASEDCVEVFSRSRLAETLRAASGKIPAYKGMADDVSHSNVYEVLHRFPIIDKAALLERFEQYSPPPRHRFFSVSGKTSGTTGTPITMLRSLDSVIWEQAFFTRMFLSSGVPVGARRAQLRGDEVVPLSRAYPPFWFHNIANRQLILSSRHLKSKFLPDYIEELKRFRPAMLQAYPSAAADLAGWLKQSGDYLNIPRIFLNSEPVYPDQREVIEEQLRGRVFETYGMAERIALANECKYGNLHVDADYSHVEILDQEGNPTDDWGYVTGTTYFNYMMPLVRYQLSDVTRWKKGACPCGKPFPMIERVTGKYEDRVFGHDGFPVSPSVITFAFKGVSHIKLAQVAQTKADLWEVRIVPFPEFGQEEEKKLVRNIREKVEPAIGLKIVILDDLPRLKSGKFRWVVNEMADVGNSRRDMESAKLVEQEIE
jgi:phenylacetate-CoA ligase